MASLLYRLGLFSARRRWLVLSVWAVLLAVVTSLALGLSRTAPEDTSFSIPGTQASEGLDVVAQKFSADAGTDTATATVVFQAPSGQTLTDANAEALQGRLAQLRAIGGVASVNDPLSPEMPRVSADQRITAATTTFTREPGDVSEATQDAFDDAARAPLPSGTGEVRVETTSDDLGGTEISYASEVIGVAVALVVLVLTYGSLVAAGANLLTAGVGVGFGVLGITAVGKVVSLSTTTPALATMLGLAVGIDYALFVFARTRSELRAGVEPHRAVATATGTAGTAVVFAGSTVIIALVGLSVVNIPFLTQMGLAAAATVAVAVLVALTAVPAALTLMGRRVLPRKERLAAPASVPAAAAAAAAPTAGDAATPCFFGRWSRGVTRHPVLALLSAVVAVGVVAVPFASLRTALPSAENADPASSSRQAYELLVEGFGEGSQATLVVVVDAEGGTSPEALGAIAAAVQAEVEALPDAVVVTPPLPSRDGTAQLITVVPGSGPTDEATRDLVRDIRSATQDARGADVLVTGETALNIDVTDSLSDALPVYVGLIVVLALVLLVMVFRSILVPLLATVGFLLSLGASLGATVAVYQWGWLSDVFGVAQPGPLLSFMPVLVVGILFGLAMDYQLFLVSAIHEAHARGRSAREAVLAGFGRSAPVVVAAALIMSGVFIGFAASGDPILGSIGTALTVGVLVDALVVRMVIMPAALTLLGEKAWWMPRWMQRAVPNVDAEGRSLEALLREQDGDDAAREERTVAVRGGASAQQRVDEALAEVPLGLVGVVTDTSGRALAGAAVTATDHGGRQLARASADDLGVYRLSLEAGGAVTVITASPRTRPLAQVVTVSDHAVRHDVALAGTASVTGRVVSARGDGSAAGAVLTLLDADGAVVGTTATTAEGAYRFAGLLAGPYVLSVLSDDHRPVAQGVTVEDGAELVVDVRLTSGVRLVGTVAAASTGRGVHKAVVTLVDAGGAVVAAVLTDEDGAYAFEDLTGGRYVVTAAGYGPVATTVEVGGEDLAVADVELRAQQAGLQHVSEVQVP